MTYKMQNKKYFSEVQLANNRFFILSSFLDNLIKIIIRISFEKKIMRSYFSNFVFYCLYVTCENFVNINKCFINCRNFVSLNFY